MTAISEQPVPATPAPEPPPERAGTRALGRLEAARARVGSFRLDDHVLITCGRTSVTARVTVTAPDRRDTPVDDVKLTATTTTTGKPLTVTAAAVAARNVSIRLHPVPRPGIEPGAVAAVSGQNAQFQYRIQDITDGTAVISHPSGWTHTILASRLYTETDPEQAFLAETAGLAPYLQVTRDGTRIGAVCARPGQSRLLHGISADGTVTADFITSGTTITVRRHGRRNFTAGSWAQAVEETWGNGAVPVPVPADDEPRAGQDQTPLPEETLP